MCEFGKILKVIFFGMIDLVISILGLLGRQVYGIIWKFRIKEGDLCTFKDISTRQKIPFLGRGVGVATYVSGSDIGVRRVYPTGKGFISKPWKLSYLSEKEWLKLHGKIMGAAVAFGLRSRGL